MFFLHITHPESKDVQALKVDNSRVMSFPIDSSLVCTLTSHTPLDTVCDEYLAEVVSFPLSDFGFGSGYFCGRATVEMKKKEDGGADDCVFFVTPKRGSWTHTTSNKSIEGDFSSTELMHLYKSESCTFEIKGKSQRFFLAYALGCFNKSTTQFVLQQEIWESVDKIVRVVRHFGSPEWRCIKYSSSLRLLDSFIQGFFDESYIVGSDDPPSIEWHSEDCSIVLVGVNDSFFYSSNLPCSYASINGFYEGDILIEENTIRMVEGKWHTKGENASLLCSLSITKNNEPIERNNVPMQLFDEIGLFSGICCMTADQKQFIPAGVGKWISCNDSSVHTDGEWERDGDLFYFMKGTKREGIAEQTGEWKNNAIWCGTVRNCSDSHFVTYGDKPCTFSGTIGDGYAVGYGTCSAETTRYEGQMQGGLPHGLGKESQVFGDKVIGVYFGFWQKGKKSGCGLFEWPDGIFTFREYRKDIFVSERPVPVTQTEALKKLYGY